MCVSIRAPSPPVMPEPTPIPVILFHGAKMSSFISVSFHGAKISSCIKQKSLPKCQRTQNSSMKFSMNVQ